VRRGKSKWWFIAVVLLICGGGLLLPQIATAQPDGCIRLVWDPVIHPDLAGYRVYQTEDKSNWPKPPAVELGKEVTSTEIQGLDLDNKIYYFRATAFSVYNEESDYSNVVSTKFPEKPDIRILPCLGP